MRSVSPNRSKNRRTRKLLCADMHGVPFDEASAWVTRGLRPKIHLVTEESAYRGIVWMTSCAACAYEYGIDPHHLIGGSSGRSNIATNILPLCRKCHDKYQSAKPLFGFLLYRKLKTDRWNTDWIWLTILYGKALPELMEFDSLSAVAAKGGR